jgi:proline dehydrogenase
MLHNTLLALVQSRQLCDFVVQRSSSRSILTRFVAGETLEEAIQATQVLNQRGIHGALAVLGEHVEDERGANELTQSYIKALAAITEHGISANISCKPTSLGLNISADLCEQNLCTILDHAHRASLFVSLDMEESTFTSQTIEIALSAFRRYNHVGTVIQAYLYRSAVDLDRLMKAGIRVRLVKGSFKEPPTCALQNKSEIDHLYVQLMMKLLVEGNYPAIATHDEAIIHTACNFVRERGISKTSFEFQMLYGIRRDLQEKLAHQGYIVRVYIPYGTHWCPYLMRRMAEYPANLLFCMAP